MKIDVNEKEAIDVYYKRIMRGWRLWAEYFPLVFVIGVMAGMSWLYDPEIDNSYIYYGKMGVLLALYISWVIWRIRRIERQAKFNLTKDQNNIET